MSLDNIQIPAIVLQEIYRNALVVPETVQQVSDNGAAQKIAFLGNNHKQIVIIINDPESIYLAEEDLNFLLGILTACKLSMADIALFNLAKNPGVTYNDILEQLDAGKVFLFGMATSAIDLPLQFPYYQVQQYNNQVYLSSPSLQALRNDKNEKAKLWLCLKQVFSIV